MKKVLSFGGFCIVLIGLLAFSLQSSGKLTDSEERNALILADEQAMGDTVNCCTGTGCNGAYCGYFVLAGTTDRIPAYWER